MATSASVDYRPNTGRLIVTIDSDAEYPDAIDDACRRLLQTFISAHVNIETYAAKADDDGCDDNTA